MALVKVVVLSLRGHDPYPQMGSDPVPPYRESAPQDTDEPLVDEAEATAAGAPAAAATATPADEVSGSPRPPSA
jgi:hypothetical protein